MSNKRYLMGGTESDFNFEYQTNLPIQECINKILASPMEYRCEFGGKLWYQCVHISETQLLITFTGGQYRKAKKTQYLATFLAEEITTKVHLTFKGELLGGAVSRLFNISMPPLTMPDDIDRFMKQKIYAVRIDAG